jgi:SSS family solute:Na+ symporter
MVGGSAFMMAFSAWTFTGAASKAYTDGWPITAIYVANAIGFFLNALYFAPRFRQLRVITSVEAIRQRFGRASEQVFMWLQIPLSTLQSAIHLNALGVFFSAVFGLDLVGTMVVIGLVVLVIALLGGSWAVLAGDFIQVLILMPVCLAVTVLALARVAGLDGFVAGLPAAHLDFSQIFTKEFLGLWCLAMIFKQITSTNNLFEASRYLAVKDSRHARWAGFLGAFLFLVGIAIWFIPPMAARILWPSLHGLFPSLQNPEEASFIAISQEVMPVGMMGLLVSGIFAATMSSMDAGLNKNAGIFIKNFYQPYMKPQAERSGTCSGVGRWTTITLGIVVIIVAVRMTELKGLGLFLMMQRVSILVGVPVTVPLLLGFLVRNTPPWSAWSTVIVGFPRVRCSSAVYFTPEWGAQPARTSTRRWMRLRASTGSRVSSSSPMSSSPPRGSWARKLFWNRTSATFKIGDPHVLHAHEHSHRFREGGRGGRGKRWTPAGSGGLADAGLCGLCAPAGLHSRTRHSAASPSSGAACWSPSSASPSC